MLDTKALADATALIVKDHISAAIAPLLAENKALRERIDVLEAAPVVSAKDIEVELLPCFEAMLEERIAALPAPVDGKDGIDGKDADPEAIKAMVAEAVTALPSAPAGEPGGKGEKGDPGRDGADGAGIADLIIDRSGNLVATFTDGRMKELGLIVGKDGRDGIDGKDGIPFGVDDLDMTLMEDGRTIRMAFTKGDTEYAFQIPVPAMIYRGVYCEGRSYAEGDVCTWGGSLWHANKETSGKPDGGDWTMCVKRGRDGKDKA
ncbi:MAG: hypothetical protein QM605_13515 [Sphingobium sp.]